MERAEQEKSRTQQQLKQSQDSHTQALQVAEAAATDLKSELSRTQLELEETKRLQEQAEVEKASLQKRIRDKDKRLAGLEGRIADLEEEKLAQFKEYQEELEAQKNILELQAVELKKRVSELTDKCDTLR